MATHPAAVDRDTADDRAWMIVAGGLIFLTLWLGMLSSGFWLDETGTWWIVKNGPAEAARRALTWSGQSPLYYLIAWASSRLFGLGEIALRLPSVVAMAGALCFVYRIAERLFDRSTAIVTAVIFMIGASFYAVDARPYGLAMFCLTASALSLMRWIERNRFIDAAACVVSGAALIYAHYIVALGLGPLLLYAVAALWNQRRRMQRLAAMAACIAALSLPLIGQLRVFYATRSTHSFIGAPGTGDLLQAFIPCSLAGALVILVWLWMASRGRTSVEGRCAWPTIVLIASWAVFAPLVLFLLPVFSDLHLFVDRYYSSALPGQALLLGFLISSIQVRAARSGLVLLLAAASIVGQGRLSVVSHGGEDWRGALGYVRAEAGNDPVLLVSPFTEGADFKSLADPRYREILFAPEAMYGEPAYSIRLPRTFPYQETAKLEEIAGQLKNVKRFYFVNDRSDRSYVLWFMGRFGSRCRMEMINRNFGALWVARFSCAGQQ